MELVAKIFEVLGISQLAFFQMALVVALAFVLSVTLVRPVLATFKERENRSVGPMEESRRLIAEAESRTRQYDESLRKAAAEALARKRARLEEASRAERRQIETSIEESNRQVEGMKERIAGEKSAASRALRAEISRLSVEIAEKVLGRRVA